MKVSTTALPIAKIPKRSNNFIILFLLTKKRKKAIGKGSIKYSAKYPALPNNPKTFPLP
jgi:hypothetical protein